MIENNIALSMSEHTKMYFNSIVLMSFSGKIKYDFFILLNLEFHSGKLTKMSLFYIQSIIYLADLQHNYISLKHQYHRI